MKLPVLPDTVLDELRHIGDPALEGEGPDAPLNIPADMGSYFAVVGTDGLRAALATCRDAQGAVIRDSVLEAVKADSNRCLDDWARVGVDVDVQGSITCARRLFNRACDEICAALLLAGLPEAYATERAAPVLVRHGGLVDALPSRIRETALFLMTLLAADDHVVANGEVVVSAAPGDPATAFVETCAGLRLFHHVLRKVLKSDPQLNTDPETGGDTPINQEDLLGTLLTFTITTFRVLDALGVDVSDDERYAYFVCWDLVGACLGIGTMAVEDSVSRRPLRPTNTTDANQLLAQLHARQWTDVQVTMEQGTPFPWSGLVDGRSLSSALIDSLAQVMPASRKSWPATVIRELALEPVRARLGLDREGVTGYLTDSLARSGRPGARVREASLRMMANEVTRHAMESFLTVPGPQFEVPGLDLGELSSLR
jgi:hypothetical protein